ncbi:MULTISPECIES: HAD family hydrolase [unclassified Fusibacter]|uniref:HAD family hydrolase n=1 Tax=unclassified Fusibacter TaxID=2624464 RepID=UPI0010124334|nr:MULTISPECIES: HAD family hydrolase [unclassified Fusibacter]MCK8059735.1 HAD family hydrolase [Fusibacter sp. A2]NPE21536.1 HAD family hydrolase [Fusibacter sp. A1]RXV61945.1 HAD family hydrolase [Fusibacter sp. A1]
MKKLIALDLDGTLLKSDHTIGEKTKHILNQLYNDGHHITIATGRILQSATVIPQMLGFPCHLVACNGAVVFHRENRPVKSHTFSYELVKEIISIMHEEGIYFHLYTEDTIYCNRIEHTAKAFERSLTESEHSHVKGVFVIDSAEELLAKRPNIFKFGIYQDGTYDFNKVRARFDALEGIETVFSNTNLLDLMIDGVSKWSGIDELAKSLGVENENVIVFGDNENDLQMIRGAGVGVVMGNAKESIKAHANHITTSNDEDGIYTFLTGYLQGE